MPTHYPSTVVNLILYFEPTMTIAGVGPLAIDGSPPSPTGGPPAATRGGHHHHRHHGTTRAATPATERAQQQSYVLDLVPSKCVVEMHGYRQAATWNFTIPWRALPVDPRTVRAWSAEIHMGVVTPQDFADGVHGDRRSSGQLTSILKTQLADGTANPATLMITGPGDTWKVEYGESGGGEVILAGRDLRGLLLDSPLTSPRDTHGSSVLDRLDLSLPIDNVVKQLLFEHGRLRDLAVMSDASEWPRGVIPSPFSITRPRHRRTAHGHGHPNGHISQDMNYWDIIVRYCTYVGAIPHMVGRTLWIRPAVALFAHGIDNLANDGQGRIPDEENSVRLVYGRDVTKLTMERKYSGNNKPKVVRAISMNPSGGLRGLGQQLHATWPPRAPRTHRTPPQTHQPGTTPAAPPQPPATPEPPNPYAGAQQQLGAGVFQQLRPAQATAPVTHNSHAANHAATTHHSPSGHDAHEELITIRADGITDQRQLEEYAKSVYEEIGRNEIDGTVESKHTTTTNSANTHAMNILQLRPGRTVELVVDGSNFSGASYGGRGSSRQTIETTLGQIAGLPFDQAFERIHQYIHDPQLARVILASYRGQIMGMLRWFRVANVRFEWTSNQTEAQIETNIDFQNYFLPRLNITHAPRATGPARGQHRHAHTGHPATPPHGPQAPHNSPMQAELEQHSAARDTGAGMTQEQMADIVARTYRNQGGND